MVLIAVVVVVVAAAGTSTIRYHQPAFRWRPRWRTRRTTAGQVRFRLCQCRPQQYRLLVPISLDSRPASQVSLSPTELMSRHGSASIAESQLASSRRSALDYRNGANHVG